MQALEASGWAKSANEDRKGGTLREERSALVMPRTKGTPAQILDLSQEKKSVARWSSIKSPLGGTNLKGGA